MPLTVPATVPVTPVAPAVSTFDHGATVTVTPPYDGGTAITAYKANVYHPYPTLVATLTQIVALDPTANVLTFEGLSDGNQYAFTCFAININGSSGESPYTLATLPAASFGPTVVGSELRPVFGVEL
jgi:hypothetical protein